MKLYQANFIVIIVVQIVQGLELEDENTNSDESSPPVEEKPDDYYSSLVGVQNLAKEEQLIVEKLIEYKKKLQETLALIDVYLDDYTKTVVNPIAKIYPEVSKNFEEGMIPTFKQTNDLEVISELISGNPLMVFALLHRFAISLEDVWTGMENIDHHSEFKDYITKLMNTKHLPTLPDVKGAADGLLRIQDTYQLPTTQMGNGFLIDKNTGCDLPATTMQLIGIRAINQGLYAIGLEWLYEAYLKVPPEDGDLTKNIIKRHMHAGRISHNKQFLNSDDNPYANVFSDLVKSNFTNIPELFIRPETSEYPVGLTYHTDHDEFNYKALCRGQQLLSPKQTKTFKCWYSHANSPFNIISPLKIEMLHENPPVLQIYDLISDRIIDDIKSQSEPHLVRGKVVDSEFKDGAASDVRTSSVAWLEDYEANDEDLLSRVPRIVNRATGLQCGYKGAAEMLQVSCYGPVGGHYRPHFDDLLLPDTPLHPRDLENVMLVGDRVATIMFYLTDVELGGGTAFPRMGIAAKAVKGSAVFWYNLKLNGEIDPLSLHGGCPVLYGNKWVANKWIRLFEQHHVRKCSKNELE